MSWILKQLSGAFGPYIMIALAAVIVVLTITTNVLWSNNTELQRDLATEKATVQSLSSANESNQKAITKLQVANQSWSDLFDRQKVKDEQAAQDQQRFREQIEANARASIDAIRRERQEPDCAALMQVDIQRVCPAAARRMRIDAGSTN